MTKRELFELLKRIEKHHTTVSLPRAIDRYGSVENARAEGHQLWGNDVPAALQALAEELAKPLPDTGAGLC